MEKTGKMMKYNYLAIHFRWIFHGVFAVPKSMD